MFVFRVPALPRKRIATGMGEHLIVEGLQAPPGPCFSRRGIGTPPNLILSRPDRGVYQGFVEPQTWVGELIHLSSSIEIHCSCCTALKRSKVYMVYLQKRCLGLTRKHRSLWF